MILSHFVLFYCSAMSCVNCFRKRAASLKIVVPPVRKVTFSETVDVIYFDKIAKDNNVCWQRAARDRMRLRRCILDTEQKISYVFKSKHRKHMYNMIHL